MTVMRLSGWFAARWWAAAILTAGLLTLSTRWAAIPAAALALAVSLWVRRQIGRFFRWLGTPVPDLLRKGWLISIPAGWGLLTVWAHIAATVTLLAFGWAVWQTLQWWQTTYTFAGDHLEVQHGIVNTTTAQVPRRNMLQAQQHRTLLGKALGYTHIQFETAAQVEFVDRARFAQPRMYEWVKDPNLIGV